MAAATLISPVCASTTGNAAGVSRDSTAPSGNRLTDAHDNQETSQEPAQLDYRAGIPFRHEVVIPGRGATAEPIRNGRQDVCRDDHEGVVFLEQRRGEDDEEETYC